MGEFEGVQLGFRCVTFSLVSLISNGYARSSCEIIRDADEIQVVRELHLQRGVGAARQTTHAVLGRAGVEEGGWDRGLAAFFGPGCGAAHGGPKCNES